MIDAKLNPFIHQAYCVLDGESISRELATDLAQLEGPDILDLVSLANKVRDKFCDEEHICTILNAKSGQCSENCKFCAQSSHHEAEIDEYSLLDSKEIVDKARFAAENGVRSFGIVTSGLGFPKANDVFKSILEAIDTIKKEFPDLGICASLGMLSEETAGELAKRNIKHYNINLQTNPERYNELIATTHDVNDRIKTIKLLQQHSIGVCTGGIIGVGETMEDRISLAFSLKELNVDVIPLNVLVPIDGTPLENSSGATIAEITKTFALFRLINPTKVIKFAAGRETIMKDFQGLLMLTGANGYLTGGYLTTRGRNISDDEVFQNQLNHFSSKK
ncbi:MAG: biotin synthase BioB [Kiritimatiellae bacterium]|nr:biotin synthase BioB [Kiritimatiellia bacterium]